MQKLKLIIPDMRKFFMSGIKTENTSCGMDMTSGSLWKKIFLFSIPLMMSQVLEVLFNMSDVSVNLQAMRHLGRLVRLQFW